MRTETIETSIIKLLLATLAFMAALIWFFRITAVAKENYFSEDTDIYETNLRTDVREMLRDEGIINPGIEITKISEDGIRTDYSVVIRPADYLELSESEKEDIIKDLEGIGFPVQDSSVEYSFS